jgi:hypothetical protein
VSLDVRYAKPAPANAPGNVFGAAQVDETPSRRMRAGPVGVPSPLSGPPAMATCVPPSAVGDSAAGLPVSVAYAAA